MTPYRTVNTGKQATRLIAQCLKAQNRLQQAAKAEETRGLKGKTLRVHHNTREETAGMGEANSKGFGFYGTLFIAALFFSNLISFVLGVPWQTSILMLLSAFALIVWQALRQKKLDAARAKVSAESARYNAIKQLNATVPFCCPEASYHFVHHCMSKRILTALIV